MNLQQFFLILAARRRVLLTAFAVCFLIAIAWVVISPSHYSATAQVLIDARGPETVNVAGDSSAAPQLQPDYLSTQVDVIRSARVSQLAVKKLGLLENPEAMSEFRQSGSAGEADAYFANNLSRNLRVTPSESSRVIAITYETNNSEGAAAIANAYTEAYREVSIDLQRQPARQSEASYRQNVAEISSKLSEAQKLLSEKRAQYNITAAGADGSDAEDARLVALQQQLAVAQSTKAAQNQRGANGALPDVVANPVVQQLQSQIAQVESQRQQFSTYAGPNNADYKQLTARVASLREELTRASAQAAASARSTSAQASAAAAQLSGAVAVQRSRVISNQRERGEIAELEANVTNLKNTYDGLAAKQAQANVLALTDQSNVVILNKAEPPVRPSGLPWLLKLFAGAFVGLFIGVMLAVLMELFDQRLRRPEDVTTWLGIPDLGVVRSHTVSGGSMRLIGSTTRYLPFSGEK